MVIVWGRAEGPFENALPVLRGQHVSGHPLQRVAHHLPTPLAVVSARLSVPRAVMVVVVCEAAVETAASRRGQHRNGIGHDVVRGTLEHVAEAAPEPLGHDAVQQRIDAAAQVIADAFEGR